MEEVVTKAWEKFLLFNGTGLHIVLFLMALPALGLLRKTDKEKSHVFLLSGYAICFFFLFFCPLTAKIIMDYCVGELVYWRMLWILPVIIVIAYAFSLGLKQIESKWKRSLCMVCMALAVVVTGKAVYTPEYLTKAENIYRIPQDAVEVCDIINEDAKRNHIEEKKAVVIRDLLPYIRQYDGSIKMPYGRGAMLNQKGLKRNSKKIYNLMFAPQMDFERLKRLSKQGGYNYLVYYREEAADEALRNLGYEKIGEQGIYVVYRIDW